MNTTITRRFQFAMGHTLHEHNGPCRHLHGHNYVLYIEVSAAELDQHDMVMDFAKVTEIVDRVLNFGYDHRFLVYQLDPRAKGLMAIDPDAVSVVKFNPTAELLADNLLARLDMDMHRHHMRVDQLTLYETENCFATARPQWPTVSKHT